MFFLNVRPGTGGGGVYEGWWKVTWEGAQYSISKELLPQPETVEIFNRVVDILREWLQLKEEGRLEFYAFPVPFEEELKVEQPNIRGAYVHSVFVPYGGEAPTKGFSATVMPWPGFKHEFRGEEPGMMISLYGRGLGPVDRIEVLFHSNDTPLVPGFSNCGQSYKVGGNYWWCNARPTDGQPHQSVEVDGKIFSGYCKEHGGLARTLREAGLPEDAKPVQLDSAPWHRTKYKRVDKYIRPVV